MVGQMGGVRDLRSFVDLFRYAYNTLLLRWHNPGYRRVFFDDKVGEPSAARARHPSISLYIVCLFDSA